MTSRRGFFGIAAGAAVSGPSIINQAAEAIAANRDKMADVMAQNSALYDYAVKAEQVTIDWAARKQSLLQELSILQTAPTFANPRWVNENELDWDLKANKSMSMVAKCTVQAARNDKRSRKERIEGILRSLWNIHHKGEDMNIYKGENDDIIRAFSVEAARKLFGV